MFSYPSLEWQQAVNEPSDTIPYKDVISMRNEGNLPPYIEWCNKPETASECYLTLSNFKLVSNKKLIISNYLNIKLVFCRVENSLKKILFYQTKKTLVLTLVFTKCSKIYKF